MKVTPLAELRAGRTATFFSEAALQAYKKYKSGQLSLATAAKVCLV